MCAKQFLDVGHGDLGHEQIERQSEYYKLNTQAAYNLGMTGILYKNPKSFTRALETCGVHLPRKAATVAQATAEPPRT